MNYDNIRIKLINIFCYCVPCYGDEKKIISSTEISASEYIRYKRRGKSDYEIYQISGYYY